MTPPLDLAALRALLAKIDVNEEYHERRCSTSSYIPEPCDCNGAHVEEMLTQLPALLDRLERAERDAARFRELTERIEDQRMKAIGSAQMAVMQMKNTPTPEQP